MLQAVQIAGAFMILIAFGLAQAKRLRTEDAPYLFLNLGGGLALGYSAVVEEQWGFILLEGAWTAIAAYGLARLLRAQPS